MKSKRQTSKMLFMLNIAHVVVGSLAFILALVQFSSIGLDNSTLIDFRMLNAAHIVTGGVGLHMVAKNFGSVVAKSLYCISLVLAAWSLAFYGDTLGQEIKQYDSMRETRSMEGGGELITDEVIRNHGGKLAVCAVMIILALLEVAVSAASLYVLDRLASDTYSNMKTRRQPPTNRRRQMAFVALMKIFFSAATVALGAYLESLYQRRFGFMKVGWEILVAAITFMGACVDLHALYGEVHNLLNLKISLILSVASAVLSLKTLDYTMTNYFVLDVHEYSRYDELKSELQDVLGGVQMNAEGDKKDAFIKFVIHAAVVGNLVLMFAHNVISAVEASSYIEWGGRAKGACSVNVLDAGRSLGVHHTNFRYHNGALRLPPPARDDESDDDVFEYDENLHRQKSCAGILQCVWGLALVALCVISLVSWDFSRGYDGGAGVLWLGCLFIASGLVNANRPKTFTTSVYVLSVVSLVLAFEHGVYSLNVVYQAVRNARFQGELDPIPSDLEKQQSNYDAHTGRITLYAIEAGVLVLEFFTATWTAVKVTQAIRSMPKPVFKSSVSLKGPLCSLGFFHLLYAFVTISVSVAAEVALWGYNVHVTYLVYLTNGVVVLAAVFVQWMAAQQPQFLLSAAILNAVTSSVAFFVVAPCVRDLYTLVAGYRSTYEAASDNSGSDVKIALTDPERRAQPVQEWIIGLNALVLLLAVAEYTVSIVSGMICSYLLHHAYDPHTSDLRFSTLRSQAPSAGQLAHYWSAGGNLRPPSLLTTAKLDNADAISRLSRRHSHSSIMGIDGMNGKLDTTVPERYFGGANDFRLYGRHAGQNDRMPYPATSTLPMNGNGARRSSLLNSGQSQLHGSVPSLYGHAQQNNGYGMMYSQQSHHGHVYGTAGNGACHNGNRANNFAQTNIRHAFANGYMSNYT